MHKQIVKQLNFTFKNEIFKTLYAHPWLQAGKQAY